MATRVEAALGAPDEAMRQALAASSVMEASVASSADMVEKEHMGEQKPVSSIGSPMCLTFFDLIMAMRDANGVSEVKFEKLVERCVRHPEENGMDEVERNAGMLLLQENLWDRWSRGLSFVKEMAERDDAHKTKSELCRSQSTLCFLQKGSCFKSRSEYVIEEWSMCCCNNDGQTWIHVNKFMIVSRGLKRGMASVKVIGSTEVGGVRWEPNVMNSDEHTKEFQSVFDSMSVVELDPRLLRESRQTEIDFVS